MFRDWLNANEMAVQHHFQFGDEAPANKPGKDPAGFKLMARPGFRHSDRELLVRDSATAEKWLNAATEKDGIHWIIGYLEPPEDAKELDPDDWAKYDQRAKEFGQQALEQFPKTALPPSNPSNTIVYVKPTSRVHPMTAWQQVHNIGHAVWNFNQPQRQKFSEELKEAIRVLQQRVYHADPQATPSEAEITIVVARLLDNLMMQRALVLQPGDMDDSAKIANTAFNAYDELMYDMVASYLRNKGHIPLKPRGVGKIAKFDRTAAMRPNPEVTAKTGAKAWVWEKLAGDAAAWDEVAKRLDKIVLEALQNCVWSKVGGPIYPYKKLTTQP